MLNIFFVETMHIVFQVPMMNRKFKIFNASFPNKCFFFLKKKQTNKYNLICTKVLNSSVFFHTCCNALLECILFNVQCFLFFFNFFYQK